MSNEPLPALIQWVATTLGSDEFTLHPLQPEASTRRFFRLLSNDQPPRIVIHSPPATENNRQFAILAVVFRQRGVRVPRIHASELVQGFFLVDDFGSEEYLDAYRDPQRYRVALELALDTLLAIQHVQDERVPPYTRTRLLDELTIFDTWCCDKLLGYDAEPMQEIAIDLVSAIDSQPKVTVHRDYHSRNLLLQDDGIGVVDFQDALVGPCTYDLASLLYDCYFEHDSEAIRGWIDRYRSLLSGTQLPTIEPREAFVRALELTALQRMLKAVGIFCRLWLLQQKATHLSYVVPVLCRASQLARRNGLETLAHWLAQEIEPQAQIKIQSLRR